MSSTRKPCSQTLRAFQTFNRSKHHFHLTCLRFRRVKCCDEAAAQRWTWITRKTGACPHSAQTQTDASRCGPSPSASPPGWDRTNLFPSRCFPLSRWPDSRKQSRFSEENNARKRGNVWLQFRPEADADSCCLMSVRTFGFLSSAGLFTCGTTDFLGWPKAL